MRYFIPRNVTGIGWALRPGLTRCYNVFPGRERRNVTTSACI